MLHHANVPEALSKQLLDVVEASPNPDPNPIDWFFHRPTEPQPIGEAERIQGLAAFWAEAKISFAYWDQVGDLDWDEAFRAYVPLVRAAESPEAYYLILRRFACLLRDGHTRVAPPEWIARDEVSPPLRLYPVQGEPVVAEGTLLPVGSRILAVQGRPVQERMRELESLLPASTDHDRLYRVTDKLLEGRKGSTVEVEAQLPDGQKRAVPLERSSPLPAPPPLERVDLGRGRVLVRINTFGDPRVVEQFHQAFPDFAGVTALILDVRRNRGGSTEFGNAILSRLTDRPLSATASQVPLYSGALSMWGLMQPTLTLHDGSIEPDRDRPRFSGPVALLTSFTTYSAAEDFSAAFRYSGRGLVVGEPTGGSTGQPVLIPLPGGGAGAICGKRSTYPDGSPYVGVGVQPHVAVAPTIAGIAAGRDEVLERALAEVGS